MAAPTPLEPSRSASVKQYALAHPRRTGVVGTGLIVLVIAGAVFVRAHPAASGLDRAWAHLMAVMQGTVLTSTAKNIFDPLGRFPLSWLVVAIVGLILWRNDRRGAILVLAAGELASWATNALIKSIVDRPRPPDALIEASRSSFPSGHAAFAAVTAVLLVGLLVPTGRRTAPGLLAAGLAVAMAWSRTYLLVHWLTDVIGGLCVGAGVGLLSLTVMSLGPPDQLTSPAARSGVDAATSEPTLPTGP